MAPSLSTQGGSSSSTVTGDRGLAAPQNNNNEQRVDYMTNLYQFNCIPQYVHFGANNGNTTTNNNSHHVRQRDNVAYNSNSNNGTTTTTSSHHEQFRQGNNVAQNWNSNNGNGNGNGNTMTSHHQPDLVANNRTSNVGNATASASYSAPPPPPRQANPSRNLDMPRSCTNLAVEDRALLSERERARRERVCRVRGCPNKRVHAWHYRQDDGREHKVPSPFCQDHSCREGLGQAGWFAWCRCPKWPMDRLCGCCMARR